MKHIAILGSTGSIGKNTLEVISRLSSKFEVVGLSTHSNIDILSGQIRRCLPKLVAVSDDFHARTLRKRLNGKIKLFAGDDAVLNIAKDKRVDLIVLAISGSAALPPLMQAIDEGKDIALANKEALVMAGNIIMQKAKAKKVKIFPIDSEHSAIWQCLDGKDKNTVKRIYLTASGGPFRNLPNTELKKVSVKNVLRHPRWKMGRKITVDSASLMNKGLELIEAVHLFGLDINQIEIVIHPEAVIHSMVEFIDGSILAQLSVTDMRIPIQYALTYPKRFSCGLNSIDFFKLGALTFYKPDVNKFPCLRIAYEVARRGGSLPCVLNAANEIAVEAFLNRKIDFLTIPKVIERVLARHDFILRPKLKDIFYVDSWARQESNKAIAKLAKSR